VFLLKDKRIIYRRSFALAYNQEQFDQVLEKINEFIIQPAQNQLFHRPINNFQIVFGQLGDLFYIFVVDTGDPHKTVQEEVQTLSNTLSGSGLNVTDLLADLENKRELDALIEQIHYSLHPKIVLIGPHGSGKTTLAQRLSKKGETIRDISEFAKVYKIQLGQLKFDLWDFVLDDDFSPLWGNYIRGSDLVVFVYNAFEKKHRKIENFINLFKREVPFKRKIFLLSHARDADEAAVTKFNETYSADLETDALKYDIMEEDSIFDVKDLLMMHLELKRPLPPRFKDLIMESNTAIDKNDFPKAIQIIDQLILIAEEHQELEYIALFRKKKAELKGEPLENKPLEEIKTGKKFTAPKKLAFSDVITVKSLDGSTTHKAGQKISVPTITSLTEDPSQTSTKRGTSRYAREGKFSGVKNKKLTFERSPLIKNEIVGLKPKKTEEKEEVEKLDEEPKEEDKYVQLKEKKHLEKQSQLHDVFTHSGPPPITAPLPTVKDEAGSPAEERLNYEAELLHKTILALGRNLSLENCRTFIQQIQLKLGKDLLDEKDVANAAQLYVKKLEDREKFTE